MQFKPTFFTSDWHIGHFNCLEFDNRPFQDLADMHRTLITRYNASVPKNGVCYFLGDMGNKSIDISTVIEKLNGTKVLIIGNHDGGMVRMYNCGFDVVLYSGSFYIGDNLVTMSHCPLLDVYREDTSEMKNIFKGEPWHGNFKEKIRKFGLKDNGQFHLHGHIHSRKDKDTNQKILDKQYDVGVTANNYTPVSLSAIESWVNTYKKEIK